MDKLSENILQSDSQSNPKNTLLAIGADNGRLAKIMEIYDFENKEWKEIINTDFKRVSFATTVLDNKLIMIGGMNNGQIVNTVESYDLHTMEIEMMEPMKQIRYCASAVEFEGNIYVIGGMYIESLKIVEKWNSSSAKWEDVASLSISRCQSGAKVLDGKIYVVGGWSGRDNYQYLSSVEMYDNLTNKWEKRADMNEKRQAPGVAVVGNFLYAVGGVNYRNVYSKTAEKYDPKVDKWTMIESMSVSRFSSAAGNFNGSLIVAGGNSRGRTSTVEVYDEKTNKWHNIEPLKKNRKDFELIEVPSHLVKDIVKKKSYTTLFAVGDTSFMGAQQLDVYDILDGKWKQAFMQFSGIRRMFTSVLLNEKLLIIGGDKSGITDTVEVYDCKTGNCGEFASMIYKRFRAKAIIFEGNVYVIGGYDGEKCIPNVEKWNPSIGSWKEIAELNTPRQSCEAAVLNEKIYVAGGYDGENEYYSSMEVYDPISDKWIFSKSMNEKRSCFAMTANGGYLYVFGGYNLPKVPTNTVEKYDPIIDKWTVINSMSIGRACLSATNMMGKIVIAGGEFDNPLRFISRVHVFNEGEKEKWNYLNSMSKTRNVFTLIEVPWDLASLVLPRAE